MAAALLVPLLLFEEWGWEPLAALAARLARLPFWGRAEAALRALPPWGALLAFLVPVLMLLPIKLFALYLLARGHSLGALLLIIGAKLVGTAFVARLFQLVEPALMRIPWFAHWYPRWKVWKDEVLAVVRHSAPWQAARRTGERVRGWWRA